MTATGLDVITISVDGHKIWAEVAIKLEDRIRGLMYRRSLGHNSGMLFVYPKTERLSIWMKNTIVPLSVAFIGNNGRIVHIEEMTPRGAMIHRSPTPVRFALEVNRGWFKERDLGSGSVARFTLPLAE